MLKLFIIMLLLVITVDLSPTVLIGFIVSSGFLSDYGCRCSAFLLVDQQGRCIQYFYLHEHEMYIS